MSDLSKEEDFIDKPPFFNSWQGMYWLVLGSLAVQVVVFYVLTQVFK